MRLGRPIFRVLGSLSDPSMVAVSSPKERHRFGFGPPERDLVATLPQESFFRCDLSVLAYRLSVNWNFERLVPVADPIGRGSSWGLCLIKDQSPGVSWVLRGMTYARNRSLCAMSGSFNSQSCQHTTWVTPNFFPISIHSFTLRRSQASLKSVRLSIP